MKQILAQSQKWLKLYDRIKFDVCERMDPGNRVEFWES